MRDAQRLAGAVLRRFAKARRAFAATAREIGVNAIGRANCGLAEEELA